LVTSDQIKRRMFKEVFHQPIMDNTMRGFWCEYMIAEALGERCNIVGTGWHAWDLQIGNSEDSFPSRVRIQVKNSAKLQIWNTVSGKLSNCSFNLTFRKRPFYFERDNPEIPCEEYGFMCDLFILCLHKEEDVAKADQTNPKQWDFFLVPVVGELSGVTPKELAATSDQCKANGKPSACMRQPHTMEKGIRGRPPIKPIGIEHLTVESIYNSLGVAQPG
jgi:hypothetical protein